MIIFPNSVDAVLCAIEIQKELSQPLEVPVRIGIHVGNVIIEPTGLIGDAVNIASRVSGLSAPGEVLVSDIVRGLARTSAAVRFEDRGEQSLKGIDDPVRVWAVLKEPSRLSRTEGGSPPEGG